MGGCGPVENVQIHNEGWHDQTCLAVLRRENLAIRYGSVIAMRLLKSPASGSQPKGLLKGDMVMRGTFMVTAKPSARSTRTRGSGMRLVRQDFWMLLILAILTLSMAGVVAASEASESEQSIGMHNGPTEFEKETIASIREITLQLILISVGVYALVGGFISGKSKSYCYKWMICLAFLVLGLSIVCGLFAYGKLIFDLSSGMFVAGGTLGNLATLQWLTFGLGGFFLICFLIKNIN